MRNSTNRPASIALAFAVLLAPTAGMLAQTGSAGTAGSGAWRRLSLPDENVSALTLDPSDPSRLFVSARNGFYVSEDAGATWSRNLGGPENAPLLVADPASDRLLAATSTGIVVSTDKGGSFRPAGPRVNVDAIAIDPGSPETAYAAGRGAYLMRSTDRGETWESLQVQGLTLGVASLLIDPGDSGQLYATGYIPGGDFDYPQAAILQSRDSGHTFQIALKVLDNGGAASQVVAGPDGQIAAAVGDRVYHLGPDESWSAGGEIGNQVTSVATDPLDPDAIYAGTDQGVFVSLDRGLDWIRAPQLDAVTSLVLDSRHRILYAGTASGVSAIDLPIAVPSFPCVPDGSTLCFLAGRFQARLAAVDRRTGRTTSGRAVAQGDVFGYFSLPDLTGDPTLPEILVKMVDAEVAPWNGDWVFYGSLTDVTYAMTVTDTISGTTRVYGNDPGQPYCGGADLSSFPATSTPASSSRPAPALGPANDALSLLNGRFRVTLVSADPRTGRAATGTALEAGDRFGYFSLPAITGNPNLPEVCVKMLDGTSLNHAFWLFESSLTSLPYELTVVDTTTNETQTYESGSALCGAADTSAFLDPGPSMPPPDGTPEIDGRWSGFFDTSDDADCDGHVPVSIVFHQDGARITGGPFTAVGACEMGGLIEGTLQGSNFFGRVIHSGFSGGATAGTASSDQITLTIADLVRPIDAFSGQVIPHGVLTLRR